MNGIADDPLTAAFGHWRETAIGHAAGFVDAANPTVGEIRRLAIYKCVPARRLDTTTAGGLWCSVWPERGLQWHCQTAPPGAVPGYEYLSYLDDGTGKAECHRQ